MTDYYGDVVLPSTYTDPASYTTWTGQDPPDSFVQYARECSALVTDATEGAYYDVDPTTGLPTDPLLVQALNDATCIQIAAWVKLGIDPNAGGVVTLGQATSKKIGSASVTYDSSDAAQVAAARAAAMVSLVPAAMKRLQQYNLLGTDVWFYG